MKRLAERTGHFLFELLPADSPLIYRICKRFVDRCHGENNSDIRTNGELRFMRRVLPRCSTVFDVGANVGEWTALALEINANLKIHCFEPSQATFRKLLDRKLPPNVLCNNTGLGAETAETKLYVFENGSALNSLYRREGIDHAGLPPQTRQESIRLITFDEYCARENVPHIDFLKLDVEGHELEAFKGMRRCLREGRIDRIQFEYGGCNIDAGVLLKDIWRFFDGLPYHFYKIYPHTIREVAHYSQSVENFQYQNWVLVKSGVGVETG